MLRTITTAALAIAVAAPPAQAGELWKAFRSCMSDALAAETMTFPLAKPEPGKTTVSVRCRGESAAMLYEAMAAVGKKGGGTGVETRSSDAVQCFRFSRPSSVTFECMVTIGVGAPFLDAL